MRCDECGEDKPNTRMYTCREAITDAFIDNICLCDDCVDEFEKMNDDVTICYME